MKSIQEQHSAGPIAVGFDYQFYYFMLMALELRHGEKVGFEVKDDVHIDKEDGTTLLYQTKHTTLKNADGTSQNLTTMDLDMWKTLSNWASFINEAASKIDFLKKHSFILITNKNENNNKFMESLATFKKDLKTNAVIDTISSIENKTTDTSLKKYCANIRKIGSRALKLFFQKLTIETDTDNIIGKIKERLFICYRDEHIVETVYNSLYSNLQSSKYLEITAGKKFEVTFEDFSNKFARCFKTSTEIKKLPLREFPILIPENPEEQIFIKQLIDIGEIHKGSEDVIEYTTLMLQFLKNFTYWSDDENFILLSEADEFKKDSITRWKNEFKSKYRAIEEKIKAGSNIVDLDDEIKHLSLGIVDYIRKLDLRIGDYMPLGINFSNGHYYLLSNDLEIGWHYDWKNKYKK
ncbi:hypothetical protein M0G43_05785 [Subsaxibacter sp. CAU 1640]|uniref:hypothetical protein n=1 Tax=Subsaxibacter sp. CAU 1640 TaxID=2933271 RepID=UPI002004F2F4|nr:hypothetical protein [Subsaxibacter sp. CAU 1640]MCK7590074.1 hypothetical protein [Subsaxibacter sp. CAU 1640]